MNVAEARELLTGAQTARDRQTSVGPSEIGGCRRRTWHRMQGTEVTNPDTLRMAAWMGTAIHKQIEKEITVKDPFGERYLLELEVEHNGLMGHVDCFDRLNYEVIDWKTTTKKNAARFPSAQQRTQVQVYGYLLSQNGYRVDNVNLVALMRDGNELDVKVHSEPYLETLAVAGLEWLRDVRECTEPPEPTENVRFCRDYCPFFDSTGSIGCAGKK